MNSTYYCKRSLSQMAQVTKLNRLEDEQLKQTLERLEKSRRRVEYGLNIGKCRVVWDIEQTKKITPNLRSQSASQEVRRSAEQPGGVSENCYCVQRVGSASSTSESANICQQQHSVMTLSSATINNQVDDSSLSRHTSTVAPSSGRVSTTTRRPHCTATRITYNNNTDAYDDYDEYEINFRSTTASRRSSSSYHRFSDVTSGTRPMVFDAGQFRPEANRNYAGLRHQRWYSVTWMRSDKGRPTEDPRRGNSFRPVGGLVGSFDSKVGQWTSGGGGKDYDRRLIRLELLKQKESLTTVQCQRRVREFCQRMQRDLTIR